MTFPRRRSEPTRSGVVSRCLKRVSVSDCHAWSYTRKVKCRLAHSTRVKGSSVEALGLANFKMAGTLDPDTLRQAVADLNRQAVAL
jgi:hypothetical protein